MGFWHALEAANQEIVQSLTRVILTNGNRFRLQRAQRQIALYNVFH
jgi:hypothetical protein